MYEKYVDIYLDALEKEINSLYKGEVLDTLYIGGGTPTSLDINRLTRLLKYYGVNRLSFGVQSFNKNMLKLLNRDYTKEDIFDIIDTAHIVGFKNINIDLIYGVPNENLDILKKDILLFLKLDITHISTYALMIENNTVLSNLNYKNIDEDLEYEMYSYIKDKLVENNFNHYEISNYSKVGYESKHNLNYWNNNSYYGFGLGAVSYIDNYRITNTSNMRNYLNNRYEKERAYEDKKTQMSNEIILGLRKTEGISLKHFEEKFNVRIEDIYDIKKLIYNHMLEEENGYLKINEKYLYISNEILCEFI